MTHKSCDVCLADGDMTTVSILHRLNETKLDLCDSCCKAINTLGDDALTTAVWSHAVHGIRFICNIKPDLLANKPTSLES